MVQLSASSPLSITALALAVLIPSTPVHAAASYNLVKNYQGPNFFNDWEFYDKYDNLTNGNAVYVSGKTANKAQLAYVNSAGRAIMKVDNTTSNLKFPDKRASVRIATKDRFAIGSVWVADMTHTPYGCSIWPAWWSTSRVWPAGGEIDTFEAVNLIPRQHMALHTEIGCKWDNASTAASAQSIFSSGSAAASASASIAAAGNSNPNDLSPGTSKIQTSSLVNSTDCSYVANNNEGCVITNPSEMSYGPAFGENGGGVWVTEFAATGISIWFFNRTSVPAAVTGSMTSIDTSTLGLPVAHYANSGCDINKFFGPQNLVFNIALCGDYAGAPPIFAQTCSGFCYQDYVLGDGSAYDNAYFEVNYVKVFGLEGRLTLINAAPARLSVYTSMSALVAAASAAFALGFGFGGW